MIRDDNRKRIDWPLDASYVDLVLGRDGEKRVILLKTKNGIFKTPVQRIYPLEIPMRDKKFVKDLRDKAKLIKRRDKTIYETIETEPEIIKKQCNVTTRRSGRVVKKN